MYIGADQAGIRLLEVGVMDATADRPPRVIHAMAARTNSVRGERMVEDEVAEALARLDALNPDDPRVTVDQDRADMRRIGAALYAVDIAHTVLVTAVADARHHGRSWTEIANVLGVSRQAARQRFGKEIVEERRVSAAEQRVGRGVVTRPAPAAGRSNVDAAGPHSDE